MEVTGWIALGAGLLMLILVGYWQLVITEGTYLGQTVVTWLYDLTARRYDDIKGFDRDMEALFLGEPLAELLAEQPDPLVLDIGTGTARLPLALLGQPPFQGRLLGIDDSRQMLEAAADKTRANRDRLWLVWRDASLLPFIDDAFDVVTCLEMLEFTRDPARQLAEAVRVLRPGGVLLTTRRRGVDARLMPGKTSTVPQFESLLRRLGLVNIQIERWQVDYDLVWATRAGEPVVGFAHPHEVLRCPRCHRGSLSQRDAWLECIVCAAAYPIRGGIIEMRD